MLSTHEIFRLGRDFTCEVNWDPKDETSNECQKFRFHLPDGKTEVVDKKLMYEMMFACGSGTEQKEMIPQTLTKVRWYETVLSVKAKKDIHKGENITFPIKLTLPNIEQEVVQAVKKKSGLILPAQP